MFLTEKDLKSCYRNGSYCSSYIDCFLREKEIEDLLSFKHEFGGTTILQYAAMNNMVRLVEILIQHNVDVNATDWNNSTALHAAASRGHFQIVDLLIKAGATIDPKAKEKDTPLMMACKNGHVLCFNQLLNAGADFLALNDKGESLIMLAARELDLDMIVLINSVANNKGYASTELKMNEALIAVVKNLNFRKKQLVEKSKELIYALIKGGADPNCVVKDMSPLMIIAESIKSKQYIDPCLEYIDVLVELGVDPEMTNTDGKKAKDFVTDPDIKFYLSSVSCFKKAGRLKSENNKMIKALNAKRKTNKPN